MILILQLCCLTIGSGFFLLAFFAYLFSTRNSRRPRSYNSAE